MKNIKKKVFNMVIKPRQSDIYCHQHLTRLGLTWDVQPSDKEIYAHCLLVILGELIICEPHRDRCLKARKRCCELLFMMP